jgi:hypothetical protein
VPPHLRPGYVKAPSPKKIDLTGRVHWPTNMNSHAVSNIIQPSRMHVPAAASAATAETLGLGSKKPALKLVSPITPNIEPVARPTTRVANFPSKFRTAVVQHLKRSMKRKVKTQKKTKVKLVGRHKPSKKTRKR